MVQLSHPYLTTGKTITLTIWTFVGKMVSLLFNMLSRFVIAFLPRTKRLLTSWLQSPPAVILVVRKTQTRTAAQCHLMPLERLKWKRPATAGVGEGAEQRARGRGAVGSLAAS